MWRNSCIYVGLPVFSEGWGYGLWVWTDKGFNFATSIALWIWANYLAPLSYSFLICKMRRVILNLCRGGKNKWGSPRKALSLAPGAWWTVLMGMGAMVITSAAAGRGKTHGDECVPPNTCELVNRKRLGEEGHKRPDLESLFKNTEIGTDWRNMCRLCYWCAKGDDGALRRSQCGYPP